MKTIFFKFATMIIIALTMTAIVEFYARHNDTGLLRVMKDRVTLVGDQADAYLMGPSHLRKSVNAELLDGNAVMLGIPGSAPNLDYLMWKEIVKGKKPKYILYEISRGYLSKLTSESVISRRKIPYYFDVDIRRNIKDNFIAQYPLWKYITWRNKREKFTEFGFKINNGRRQNKFAMLNYDEEKIIASHQVMKITTCFKTINKRAENINEQHLNEMIAYCKQNDIKVFIITSPKYKVYNDLMNSYHIDKLQSYINEISKYDNVTYWDFSRLYEDDIEGFTDLNHATSATATKFTEMLNIKIQESLNSH